MDWRFGRHVSTLSQNALMHCWRDCLARHTLFLTGFKCQYRSICADQRIRAPAEHRGGRHRATQAFNKTDQTSILTKASRLSMGLHLLRHEGERHKHGRKIFGTPALPSTRKCDSCCTFTTFSGGSTQVQTNHSLTPSKLIADWKKFDIKDDNHSESLTWKEIYQRGTTGIAEPTLCLFQVSAEGCTAFEIKFTKRNTHVYNSKTLPKRLVGRQTHLATRKDKRGAATAPFRTQNTAVAGTNADKIVQCNRGIKISHPPSNEADSTFLMTSDSSKPVSEAGPDSLPAQHRPLVVGLTKRSSQASTMASTEEAAALNKEIEKNIKANTKSAAPAEETTAEPSQTKPKKEKAPKQPKPSKAAPAAPTSPALIDLRVGHILRAIAHPNADSLYVSTIAMGDPEGTEHTQVDEETGKVVRTVCSGLNGLIPLAEMQDRKIIVVANLKPVNMRSIKSAAMVLAASPQREEGADPHAHDRVVELVMPPQGSEAGDKVYFEGWPYGEGQGPEKQLNPKKKQWEAIQPGFYTSDDLIVGFDASKCEDVSGNERGNLIVEGKGHCTVKTLKGAAVN